VQDGDTGFLVESVVECAEALHSILEHPADARAMALRGKEYVRKNFLSPRLLRDWLALFNRLVGNDLAGAELVVAGAV
jgi:trehalose synthase